MSKVKVSAPVKIVTARKLWLAALIETRAGWKIYLLVVLLIALPIRLLSLSSQLASDGSFTAYITFASVVMYLALLSVAWRRSHNESVSLKIAFYDGTSNFVQFILVSLLLALCLAPAAFGALLFNSGQSVGAPTGELLVLGGFALLVAVPSIWALARFLPAMVISANTRSRPFESLRLSRNLTLGRFWLVLGRLASLLLGVTILAVVAYLFVILISLVVHKSAILDNIFQFILSILVLPFGSVYLTMLYNALVKTSTVTAKIKE